MSRAKDHKTIFDEPFKSRAIKLRQQGLTYDQIQKQLHCRRYFLTQLFVQQKKMPSRVPLLSPADIKDIKQYFSVLSKTHTIGSYARKLNISYGALELRLKRAGIKVSKIIKTHFICWKCKHQLPISERSSFGTCKKCSSKYHKKYYRTHDFRWKQD